MFEIANFCDSWKNSVKFDYNRCYTEFFLYNQLLGFGEKDIYESHIYPRRS